MICHSSYDFLSGQARKEQGKRLLVLPAVSGYSNVQLPFKRKAFKSGLVMPACDPCYPGGQDGRVRLPSEFRPSVGDLVSTHYFISN